MATNPHDTSVERPSLLMRGVPVRVAGAMALLVLLWLLVGWALGEPA